MKKQLAGIITAALLCTSVSAENVSYNDVSNEITVAGNKSGEINILIISDDMTPTNISSDKLPVYARQFTAKGNFSHIYYPDENLPTDDYNVYLNGQLYGNFSYVNLPLANKYITENVDVALTEEEFYNAVKNSESYLGIDFVNDGAYLSDSCKMIYGKIPFVNYSAFKAAYGKALAIVKMSSASAEQIEALLKENASYLGIDFENGYEKVLNTVAKAKLQSIIANADLLNSDFAPIWEEALIAAECAGAEHWTELKETITNNSAKIGIDLTNVQNEDKIFADMIVSKNLFDSFKNISDAFNASDSKINGTGPNNPGLGGTVIGGNLGGGTGGGGGGAPAYSASTSTSNEVKTNTPVFDDLDSYEWALEAITELSANGVISGTGNGKFAPEANVTRAEISKMLAASLKLEQQSSDFSDVYSNDWFYGYVGAMEKYGAISGFDGNFNPHDNLTRQDAAVILMRILKKQGIIFENKKSFADDNDIADYAVDAVAFLAGAEIINGTGNNMFAPLKMLTRAEAAVLLYNTFSE